jgi:undecaprenyl-diphosphatase
MPIVEWLIQADKRCFIFIQTHLTNSGLDRVMLLCRDPWTWTPLYAFMLYWIFKNNRRQALSFILLTLIAVSIADYTAAQWLKPLFGRWRPCYDPETLPYLRGLISCGGLFSFPSNHATNHFAMASFWFGVVRQSTGKRWYWLWCWALLVCAAQVYVGKHFLLDVLAGSLYGTGIGTAGVWLFRRWPLIKPKFANWFRVDKPSHRPRCTALTPKTR